MGIRAMKFFVLIDNGDDEPFGVEVTADYQQIQNGHLIFRNQSRGNNYPEMVVSYAPGRWLEVCGRVGSVSLVETHLPEPGTSGL